ncbi:CRISPR/Cas system-associated endonuclease Cas1 [Campylobacter blaseri]|uniref:CRISPR-associated endonuclease Cas1 n=1 Tax=Campylobacter blaseri TaxID=2042961 RepID=A0A2P8R3D9_9BACT|nr:type II CRISPR-associated endonuclease Cas1 [Campylobacter blaseri]PSM53008.1 subtype II CRISPR-associated endonuclease Cas1 [Campylobacter blaseri]PSM54475.1 subtype II CRISPR-associated endonuclease Cas1 [Campylobacter blaseri]QKF85280.1 CRISPR/Cas system-associated endonuclease Cas1 [Campylobacter blaseri]
MSWRTVCINGIAKLDLKFGYLVVRKENISKIALNEIAVLVIDSTAISLTTALLNELIKRKVKVIFCDSFHNPFSELAPMYGSHDSSLKIKKQMLWKDEMKAQIWTRIIKEKIYKQMYNLIIFDYKKEAKLLEKYISEIKLNDETNREGHAAKVYFNALFGMKFTRDSDNSINAALNYGYSLLLSTFNKEISSNGYITQIGLFHDNRFNYFNLSCDLMEIFRPIVDKMVYELQPKVFEKEEKICMLELFNKKVMIENKEQFLMSAINVYVKSVLDSLNENNMLLEIYDEF